MITTVILDLDDTLYDEIDYCRSGFRAVAEFVTDQPKMPPAERIFDAFWREFTGGNRRTVFNEAVGRLGIAGEPALIEKLVHVYRNHTPQISLPRDSKDALEELRGKYALALLTDGFLPAQRLKVQALDIERYFRCILYTEELGREFWKPSPVGFEKLMESLNAKASTSVYVADNAMKDFIAPNQLGMATIQLIRPAGLHRQPARQPDAAAQHIIHSIRQLPQFLEGL
jgi:putative hydrolase of the HAD superfamily